MHDSVFENEKKAQFKRDRAAFETLHGWQKKGAKAIGVPGFYLRHGIVTLTKTVVGAVEFAFNVLFRLPYVLAWKGLKKLAQGAVGLAKLGIKALSGLGRGALVTGRKTLAAAGLSVIWLEKKGWMSSDSKDRKLGRLEKGKTRLLHLRDDLVNWEKSTKEKIDKTWHEVREDLKNFGHRAKENLEKYGSVGLFRATKWVLNPRTPSGKPLLYNETINKAAGLALAAVGFTALAFEVGKLSAMIKIWNAKFLGTLIKGAGMSAKEIASETALHAGVTAGGVALKFVTLPIIAATRQTLKSTAFTQGVAYQYNLRLNALKEKKTARRAARAEKNKYFRWLGRKKPLSFVTRFVSHIVQQASPEFYEIKMREYRDPSAIPAMTPDFKEASAPSAMSKTPPSPPSPGSKPGL